MEKIKKYANRKLYDTKNKRYITLDQISDLIKAGKKISVVDNKTRKDITFSTISQILARDKKVKSGDPAFKVLVQLIRKGPGTLVDYGKRYVSLWERALTTADEEIDKLVDRLVKDKELSRSEAKRLRSDISGRADNIKNWIGDKIDQRINEALGVMNLATKDQVNRLKAKVDSLGKKVNRLDKVYGQKAKG